jgi:NTP pyrophosphatase (non-canonical NTP hydrolase)
MEQRDWDGIRNLVEESHAMSVDKGFYEGVDLLGHKEEIGNKLMLIVGEVSEAHEEIRAGIDPRETYYPTKTPTAPAWMTQPLDLHTVHKPEGVPSELADIVIRVADLAGALGIDLAGAIKEKQAYNATRPHKHGKKF